MGMISNPASSGCEHLTFSAHLLDRLSTSFPPIIVFPHGSSLLAGISQMSARNGCEIEKKYGFWSGW